MLNIAVCNLNHNSLYPPYALFILKFYHNIKHSADEGKDDD